MSVDVRSVSRVVDHPSIVNMRDLGGLRTRTGRLRRGLLFRSGSFAGTSAGDASWLVRATGLRTLVDLRTRREIDRDGRPDSLIALGVTWRSVPFGVDGFLTGRHGVPADLVTEYRRLTATAAEPVRHVLTAIGRDESPLVFACSMGKDRTGVVAGLLLSALGVRRRDIARDYALTARCLRPRAALLGKLADRKRIPVREVAGRLETRPATMHALLDAITRDYAGDWCAHAGIDAALIGRAQAILTEGTP